MIGFCKIWILNSGLIAKSFYEALKGTDQEPLIWIGQCRKAFQTIKGKLLMAPALGFLELRKQFDSFVHERQELGLRVLTQNLGNSKMPVAYFLKQLNTVTQESLVHLRATAATRDFPQEAEKFILSHPPQYFLHTVCCPYKNKRENSGGPPFGWENTRPSF